VSAYFDGKPVLYKPPQHGATNEMLWNLYVQSVEQNKGDIGAANPGLNTGLDSLAGFLKIIGKIFSWLTTLKNWERVGLMLLGALVVLVVVLAVLKKQTPTLGDIASVVKSGGDIASG